MSNISVIGCGKMGSALTKAFLKSGHNVFVYDLFKESCMPLVKEGAQLAQTPIEAAQNCEMMVFSINNYTNSLDLLENKNIFPHLTGKTLVQLTSGTPQDAQELEKIVKQHNINYLDGAIMCYPHQIGTEESCILISGNEETFKNSEEALKSLTKNLMFLSSSVGDAATLDCAMLTFYYAMYWGILQASAICKQQNFPVQRFANMAKDFSLPVAREILNHAPQSIESGNYTESMASNTVHVGALQHCIELMHKSNLDSSVAESLLSLIENAISSGYGSKDLESIVEVIKK